MTETEYLNELESKTGLKSGIDFAIIIGTTAPFTLDRGMYSASMVQGYTIWKKEKDGAIRQLNTRGLDMMDTIAFLTKSQEELETYFKGIGLSIFKE